MPFNISLNPREQIAEHHKEREANRAVEKMLDERFKRARTERPKRVEKALLALKRSAELQELDREKAEAILLETNIIEHRIALKRQGVIDRYAAQGLDD